MTYTIKRFSWTGETRSISAHEETINGKTSGEIEVSRGKYRDHKKPVRKTIRLKYHDKY